MQSHTSLSQPQRLCPVLGKPPSFTNFLKVTSILSVEAKLHDESRLIQICFDDNQGDDKKLKGQSKNEFKIFKIESRTLQDSRGKLISRIKNQESSFKRSRFQESRFKRSRFKTQDSRINRRLNQDKYEKVFLKN